MGLRHLSSRVVATVITVAAALLVSPTSTPANAAGALCSGAGVNVVVDFRELGGGSQLGCDSPGAARTAAQIFPAAGFPLDYVQRQPGFVCRVSGKPATDPCVNTPPSNAYWGLWWSDGESGTWTYSSLGVNSLKVPVGGSVGLSWIGGGGSVPPGVAPPRAPEPEPTPTPTQQPSADPGDDPTDAPTNPDPDPAPAQRPTRQPSPGPGDDPTDGPSGPGDGPTDGGAAAGKPSGGTPAPVTTPTPDAPAPSATEPTLDPAGTNGMGRDGPDKMGKAGPDKEKSSRDKTSPQQAKGDRDKGDRDKGDRATPSRTPSAIASDPSDPNSAAAAGETVLDQADGTSQDGRLPLWVPLGVLVLALLGTVATVVVRRRTGSAG